MKLFIFILAFTFCACSTQQPSNEAQAPSAPRVSQAFCAGTFAVGAAVITSSLTATFINTQAKTDASTMATTQVLGTFIGAALGAFAGKYVCT